MSRWPVGIRGQVAQRVNERADGLVQRQMTQSETTGAWNGYSAKS